MLIFRVFSFFHSPITFIMYGWHAAILREPFYCGTQNDYPRDAKLNELKRVRFMFPAQNLRFPPSSAMLGVSGSIYPWNNRAYFCRALFHCNSICLKLVVHIQAEQDGEMNQMTLPYRHRVRNLSPGDLRKIRLVSVTEHILKLEHQSVSCHLLHHNNQTCISVYFFHG